MPEWIPSGVTPETDPDRLAALTSFAAACRVEYAQIRAANGGRQSYIDWSPETSDGRVHAKQAQSWYLRARFRVYIASSRNGKTHAGTAKDIFTATAKPPEWFLHPERLPYLHALPWPWLPPPERRAAGHRTQTIVITPNADARELGTALYMRDWMPGLRECERTGQPSGWVTEIDTDQKGRLRHVATQLGDIRYLSEDQGMDAIEGVQVDRVHVDEELVGTQSDRLMVSLQTRIADRHGHIEVTATANESAKRGGATWLVTKVLKPCKAGLHDPQDFQVVQAGLRENPFLDEEGYRAVEDACRDPVTREPTWEWAVRVDGDCTGAALRPAIDPGCIDYQRKTHLRAPLYRARLANTAQWEQRSGHMAIPAWLAAPRDVTRDQITLERDPHGPLWVYREPVPGHDYTLGVDVGTGVVAGNPHAAVVYDRHDGEVVARLWHNGTQSVLMLDCIALGHYYNSAWLCVELSPVSAKLVGDFAGSDVGHARYPRLYHHDIAGGYTDVQRVPGYPMRGTHDQEVMLAHINAKLRPAITGDVATIAIRIPDDRILDELAGMMRDEKDRVTYARISEGSVTTHCDSAVALGMALIADNSPACPMAAPERPWRPAYADPRTEAMTRWLERVDRAAAPSPGVIESSPYDDAIVVNPPW